MARENSGGIDHPIVAIALQSIRTPEVVDRINSLAVGIGVFDREYLELLSDGKEEPVIALSYVSARLVGNYYFGHELHPIRSFRIESDCGKAGPGGRRVG